MRKKSYQFGFQRELGPPRALRSMLERWEVFRRPLVLLCVLSGLLATSVASLAGADSTISPTYLRCEYLVDPIGIDEQSPRLSWRLESGVRGARQTAWRIVVGSSPESVASGKGELWDSGKVATDQSSGIRYAGHPLESTQSAWWAVKVWDGEGRASRWSEPAQWEMGLLNSDDWSGDWIARYPSDDKSLSGVTPMPLFRRSFDIEGTVKQARVFIVGLGYFELRVNGQKVGDHLLDPTYTRYDRGILYVTHDLTEQIRSGQNALGVMLGNGWFNVHAEAAWNFNQAPWRDTPRLLLEMRVEMEDGREFRLSTDGDWRTSDGPITFASLYGGENYDARLEQAGWDEASFDDSEWEAAILVDSPKGELRAQSMHPVRVTKTLSAVSVSEVAPDVFLYDFGQNMTGNAELTMSAPEGAVVSLRYGERLDDEGRLDQYEIAKHVLRRNPEQQFQTDQYTFKGEGTESWVSRFTYHGFRYVEVSGLSGLKANNLKAHFSHSDVPEVGTFSCSNEILNKVWENGRWSYLGNLYGIPTDCPHREKNGWTGDAQIACEQGLFYQDGITVYEKWIDDFADEQFPTGALPAIIPTNGLWGYKWGSGPAWDSAFLIVPWHLYEYYGDATALIDNYKGYKSYLGYLSSRAQDNIVDIGLGDWSPWKTKTPEAITDTAYYFRDASIVAAIAAMIGNHEDEEVYAAMAEDIREAFKREFFDLETGTVRSNTQTALGCALYFGLLEPEEEEQVFDALVAVIEANDNKLDFGYLGTKYVFNSLTKFGRPDLALKMITQPEAPSFAWQISQGATTLWENWQGHQSLNHTFFGDVNAWMMKTVAGVQMDPENPGFTHFFVRPKLVEELEWAQGSYDSIKGKIVSKWKRSNDSLVFEVVVPANTTATVELPLLGFSQVTEGGKPLNEIRGVEILESDEGQVTLLVGSGRYAFEVID